MQFCRLLRLIFFFLCWRWWVKPFRRKKISHLRGLCCRICQKKRLQSVRNKARRITSSALCVCLSVLLRISSSPAQVHWLQINSLPPRKSIPFCQPTLWFTVCNSISSAECSRWKVAELNWALDSSLNVLSVPENKYQPMIKQKHHTLGLLPPQEEPPSKC